MTTAQIPISVEKLPSGPKPSRLGTEWQKQKARHAAAMADKIEMQNKITRGAHVAREDVRRASATALATISQALRILPDTIERKYSLDSDVIEGIAVAIDSALDDCATSLARMTPDQ